VILPEQLTSTEDRLRDAWRSDSIPGLQLQLIQKQLEEYRRGGSLSHFDGLVELLRHNIKDLDSRSILEVGCSSGYYSEVLSLRGISCDYTGCDFSSSFIRLAKLNYPERAFDEQDATNLTYAEGSFDVVISGCCILHIVHYKKAIAESARVAREYVLFHRTPVLIQGETSYFTKHGYNHEMIEIHFSEQDLFRNFSANGLAVVDVATLAVTRSLKNALAHKTYLCKKICP
jgi:SAM-dependent methyltransferase